MELSRLNIGVIGIAGAWSTEALSASLARKGAGGKIVQLNEISYDLASGDVYSKQQNLNEFDGFII